MPRYVLLGSQVDIPFSWNTIFSEFSAIKPTTRQHQLINQSYDSMRIYRNLKPHTHIVVGRERETERRQIVCRFM